MQDHKLSVKAEFDRMQDFGGEMRKLVNDGVYRLFVPNDEVPGLTLTRAIGDRLGHEAGVVHFCGTHRGVFAHIPGRRDSGRVPCVHVCSAASSRMRGRRSFLTAALSARTHGYRRRIPCLRWRCCSACPRVRERERRRSSHPMLSICG